MRNFDVKSIREDFPILGREVYGRPLVYLDNAATAQKPRRVLNAISGMYFDTNSNVHRGGHMLSGESTALYESARERIREFIGAESREEIIFTSGATGSLNVCARSLCELLVGEGDNIIVSEMEHHSNLVPWQLSVGGASTGTRWQVKGKRKCRNKGGSIRMLPFTDDGLPDIEALKTLIDEHTRVIAITQCSNVLGTRPDIAQISRIAHRHDIVVVVDGCQGVVHGGVNVREIDCDLYAFSGHKLYGPTGIGVLYGKKALLERMPPLVGGGDMVTAVTFAETGFADLPYKFEAGTANYIGAVGVAEAINYLSEFEAEDLERHEQALLNVATDELLRIDGLTIYGTAPGKTSIVSFTVEGVHSYDLGALLDKQGIAVRTGIHCTQPLVEHYGVPSICRASFAVYNTVEEASILAAGVKKAVKMLRR